MRILLLRHGKAAPEGSDGTDESRPLASRGRRQSRDAGALAARLSLSPTRVCASPLLRTRETAEGFLSAFKKPANIELLQALAPGGDPDEALDETRGMGEEGVLLLVGHNPGIGVLAQRLGVALSFTPATLAVFNFVNRRVDASLELFIRPDEMERLTGD
jgi:phosphohistidine phosphatase